MSRDANVITLENGCVCCSVRADLVAQLTALLEGPAAPSTCSSRRAALPIRAGSWSRFAIRTCAASRASTA